MSEDKKYKTPSYLTYADILKKLQLKENEIQEAEAELYKQVLEEANREVDLSVTTYAATRPLVEGSNPYILASEFAYTAWSRKLAISQHDEPQQIEQLRKESELKRKNFEQLLKELPDENPRGTLASTGVNFSGGDLLPDPLETSNTGRDATWSQP